uniref:Rna/rnp complex 1 interacting phosphatase n=1 Tax=Rhipicephalus zambeziensis TaxID=60191 RepID=A0A224YYK9_9ACAR
MFPSFSFRWQPLVPRVERAFRTRQLTYNMGRSKTVPDRWLDYSDVGGVVPGTRFIAFKVPLRESICSRVPASKRFTPHELLQRIQGLGLVIDLTCTNRYYDPDSLVTRGILHAKIMCVGQQIPSDGVVSDFFRAVDAFLADPANDGKLVGVHCTHGVNRTGYLVCKYMIEKLSIAPATAIEQFQNARGHKFDRDEYVSDLQRVGGQVPTLDLRSDDKRLQAREHAQAAGREEYARDALRLQDMQDQYVRNFLSSDRRQYVGNIQCSRDAGSSRPPEVAVPVPADGDVYRDINSRAASGTLPYGHSAWNAAQSEDYTRAYGHTGDMPRALPPQVNVPDMRSQTQSYQNGVPPRPSAFVPVRPQHSYSHPSALTPQANMYNAQLQGQSYGHTSGMAVSLQHQHSFYNAWPQGQGYSNHGGMAPQHSSFNSPLQGPGYSQPSGMPLQQNVSHAPSLGPVRSPSRVTSPNVVTADMYGGHGAYKPYSDDERQYWRR